MGHPCGYLFGTCFSRFIVPIKNFQLTIFLEGNLSFIEAPWQPFTEQTTLPSLFFDRQFLKDGRSLFTQCMIGICLQATRNYQYLQQRHKILMIDKMDLGCPHVLVTSTFF